MTIWSMNHWNHDDEEIHLCAMISLFMDKEMSIQMDIGQVLLFRNTPEFQLMKEAAEKKLHDNYAPRNPMVEPPPQNHGPVS